MGEATDLRDDISMHALLKGEQAAALASMARSYGFNHSLLEKVAIKKFDEMGLDQAIAGKEAGKTGAHTDPRLPVAVPGIV